MIRALLRRIRRSRQRNHESTPPRTAPIAPVAVLLWGPEYDELTRHTSRWLRQITPPNAVAVYAAYGGGVNRDRIVSLLEATNGSARVIIFGGHGIATALLGPPRRDDSDYVLGSARHSVLYDEHLVDAFPCSLFVFCCDSGQELGVKFAPHENSMFLGYSGELFFNVRNETCESIWQQIVGKISLSVMGDGGILPKHKVELKQLYDQAYSYFASGEGRGNSESVLMQMYLLDHGRLVRYYGRRG